MFLSLALAATHRYPFNRGRDFFFRTFVQGRALQERLATLPNPRRTRRGFEVFCNSRDIVSDRITLWGEYERKTEDFLIDALADGGTFLDLGANVGYFTLLVAHELAGRCRVISFEPNPPIFQLLRQGAAASRGAGAIRVVPLAISDRAGRLEFVIDPGNTGHSHLAAAGECGATQTVDVVILDDWLASNPPSSRIAAVKLDVEGCELRALRGMERTLREHRPALVVEAIEEHLRSFGDSIAALNAFLESVGYEPGGAAAADGNLYLPAPRTGPAR